MTDERIREIAEQVAMLPPEKLDTQDNLIRDIETAIRTALAEEEKTIRGDVRREEYQRATENARASIKEEVRNIRAEVWREAAELAMERVTRLKDKGYPESEWVPAAAFAHIFKQKAEALLDSNGEPGSVSKKRDRERSNDT